MPIEHDHTIHAHRHHFGWSLDHNPTQMIAPGDTVEFEVIDAAGGEITPETKVEDLAGLDHSRFAPLTGPIFVDGAQPGDALKVTIREFMPSGWG